MNKFILGLITVLSFQSALAQCLGEAQIIAKVKGIQEMGSACYAEIDTATVRFYQPSGVCPLDLGEVIRVGVKGEMVTEFQCSYKAGDEINGVLVLDRNGDIILE